jgi:uncharacterized membrane protein
MKPRKFVHALQREEIVAAIREAEKKTSGEIRVFVSRKSVENALVEAQSHFVEMAMNKTRERNGVLIFVAPISHNFAVVGDTAVHAKCGEDFWKQLTGEMSQYFRDSHFTRGIVHGVRKAGELLAQHFPHRPDDENELPDAVEEG